MSRANPHPWSSHNPRVNARNWDGCERAVVRIETFKPIGTGKSVRRLYLECGHSQTATASRQTQAAICRQCMADGSCKEAETTTDRSN